MAQSHSFAEIVGLEALQADLLAEKGSYEELVEEKLKAIGSSATILLSEVVGKQWRGRVGSSVVFLLPGRSPLFLVSILLLETCTRRTPLLILSLTSGMLCVMIAVVGQKLKMVQITLSLSTFPCVDTAFDIILKYSIELFPTCIRNFAASLARQAMTFGAVLGSLLISAGRNNPYLSYGVFGLIIIFCGFFELILPETRCTSLCDTMDQQEQKENSIAHST
ncbi:hypothetical protein JRO89_XS14G0042700 [Xanthoceras sorbifolium]|uniref:Uncharacterized protein n=1 Tax=Xanthoceras sorbifolium TaxID=99658 RepID=A0ABQ8H3R9_9ROSI|nr:hypothetical protein JRO89_XS14G0042700 [Xanthoceras sorbifolium]